MSDEARDPRFLAAIDLIGRTGAKSVQVRYSDDEQPIVWMVVGEFPTPTGWQFEATAGLTPLRAAMRLLEATVDGGKCSHCGRGSGVWEQWAETPPWDEMICWYVFDPETSKFRRSCEGETTGERSFGRDPRTGEVVGRNDLCPCGSGKKWKHCHGSGRQ